MTRPQQILAWLLAAGLALTATGCSSNDPPASPTVDWRTTALPSGFEPSLIVRGPHSSLLVASDGDADGHRAPALVLLKNDATTEVPVKPSTTYGAVAAWRGFAVRGDDIYAVGGRSGGAHGNIRWTAWSGTTADLSEEAQDFETFGGPDAGGLVGAVAPAGGGPLIVGSRVGLAHDGLDITVWDHDSHRWVRRSSAGTALAAGGDRQPSAHGATDRGTGVLIAGGVTEFFGDKPRTVPAVWTSAAPHAPWTRTELPSGEAGGAEAQAATCSLSRACLMVGYVGDHLAAWSLSPEGKVTAIKLPDLAGGPQQSVLVATGQSGHAAIAVSDPSGAAHVVLLDGGHGRETNVPPGKITGLALIDRTLWVVAATKSGSALWSGSAR